MGEAVPAFDPRTLGLSPEEIREAERRAGRPLSPLEWTILSVQWSEHCSYKHSKQLLGTLPKAGPRVLAGPGESAGVLDIGGGWAVAAKIESHNHPSAVEPFQGAATGVGGIMRDILAMGARPAAFLDSLRFGSTDAPHVRFLEQGVVAGIGHYGNCVGVPTVGGDVYYHRSYARNPLVNAMCVGFLRHGELRRSAAGGEDARFLLIGAATGRDGVGGAAFASVSLRADASEDRPHVQVGDPFRGKLLVEATLEILRETEVEAVQDLGAGGIAGAAIEMSAKGGVGVEIWLERVPLRENGMQPGEILLSESQERMLLCLPEASLDAAHAIAERWGVSHAEIGRVLGADEVRLTLRGETLSALPASLYVDAPTVPLHPAEREAPVRAIPADREVGDPAAALLALLAQPNLSDRSRVYQTYDQDVGLRTVCRPGLDAAVLRAAPGGPGVALATDQNPRYCALDARTGAELAVLEAARNVLARGAQPIGLTNCLNLGDPDDPGVARQLMETVEGIRRAADAIGIPVTGGNVSLYNRAQETDIVPTPVIGMLGLLDSPEQALGVHVGPGELDVVLLGAPAASLSGSAYAEWQGIAPGPLEAPDYRQFHAAARLLLEARDGEIALAHDLSDGGLLAALAEVALHLGRGLAVRLEDARAVRLFGEPTCQFLLLCPDAEPTMQTARRLGVPVARIGRTAPAPQLSVQAGAAQAVVTLEELSAARGGAG